MNDFANAVAAAHALDQRVHTSASAISADYESIASLSVRQAFGATEATVARTASGGFNASDVLVFMKGLHKLLETTNPPLIAI